LLCSLCTNSFALPIELDTYRHKLSKDEIKEVLAGYDADTLKEVLAEAGLYDVSRLINQINTPITARLISI
jgi:hypothetical protein